MEIYDAVILHIQASTVNEHPVALAPNLASTAVTSHSNPLKIGLLEPARKPGRDHTFKNLGVAPFAVAADMPAARADPGPLSQGVCIAHSSSARPGTR